MPELIRIEIGTGNFGKTRTKKLVVCGHSRCKYRMQQINGEINMTTAEIREHEQQHRDCKLDEYGEET
jgi:hypothetical protein